MRGKVVIVGALLALSAQASLFGAPQEADAKDLESVWSTLRAPGATDAPLFYRNDSGFIRFLGAPPGGRFETSTTAKSGDAAAAAAQYLDDHGKAFGFMSSEIGLKKSRVQSNGNRTVVRFDQRYGALTVFGAEVVVQVDAAGDIVSIANDTAQDVRPLDDGAISTTPRISGAAAVEKAKIAVAGRNEGCAVSDLKISDGPDLMIYDPVVLGLSGPMHLVWRVKVGRVEAPPVSEEVLVDAQSGEEALHYSLVREGLNRIIYDLDNSYYIPDMPARVEYQAPVGIPDIDNLFDYFEDVYDFFLDHHGWDNFDGGTQDPPSGYDYMPVLAYARLPWLNASYNGPGPSARFYFGTGFVIDDVVGHEFTHGVTDYKCSLIYQGYSGAISEAFSDIWGEFVDQTNGAGNDDPDVRWLLGEDFSEEILLEMMGEDPPVPALRDMHDPTLLESPDRLNSPLVIDPGSGYDNGGVHYNNGIGNKLCYLLTDGDAFNGQTVEGMGMDTVADLFWECQGTLTESADYYDLYFSLMQGAVDLGLSLSERLNIFEACQAVEIVPDGLSINLRAIPVYQNTGIPAVALYWDLADVDEISNVKILRSPIGYTTDEAQAQVVYAGLASQYLDADVVSGVEYFYTLVQDCGVDGFSVSHANAVAGEDAPDYLTEAFSEDAPMDLANTQLTFTPVGAPANAFGEGGISTGYERYELTVVRGIHELPVPREDGQGSAVAISFLTDQYISLNWQERSFMFFGMPQQMLTISENGYITFQPVDTADPSNFPSLASHFALPRISFLFCDLATMIGGNYWMRTLDDRIVITFENIPVNAVAGNPPPEGNTVQVEFFECGRIRITYKQLAVTDAIVGLSDGKGALIDPAELFDDVQSVDFSSDLSDASSAPSRLRIEPIGTQSADIGERIEFGVVADGAGLGNPQILAEWDGPISVPFADRGDGTGTFLWNTTLQDAGVYSVRFTAVLGSESAYQDVAVNVGEAQELMPKATDLRLSTGVPIEDPTQDRDIAPGLPLYADYTYTHPLLGSDDEENNDAESGSQIFWYRNFAILPGLTNRLSVPGNTTRSGETWSFAVLPRSRRPITGELALSPTVYVLAVPELVSISPNFGDVVGGDSVIISGDLLSNPIQVTFGGIKASQYISLGDGKLQVVTPLHVAGTVDVLVKTPKGSGVLKNGFSYVTDAAKVPDPDVNGDGTVDALDVQIVINAILAQSKTALNADANRDGKINAADVQSVVNAVIYR